MRTYLLSIVTAAVALALSEFIIPEGKLKTPAKTVLSLVFLLSVVFPFAKYDFSELDNVFSEKSVITGQFNQTENYFSERIEKYYSERYIRELKDADLICDKIEVEVENGEVKKIEVFLSNAVISGGDENIIINEIRNYVSETLGVSAEIIVIHV